VPSTDLVARAGEVYRRVVADPESAGPGVRDLVTDARSSGDPRALVAALRAEGWFERSRLAHERAIEVLDEAVRTARRHRLQPQWREALVTRGAIRHEQGRVDAAQRDFTRAAAFVGEDGGDVDVELEHQQAALHLNTGRLVEAATAYRRILDDAGASAEMRTKAANNLGIIEVQCGRIESGLALFERATEEARHVGPGLAAFIAEGRAWATVRAGRLTEGLELFDEAAMMWAAAEMPLGELYSEYAEALIDLRLIPEALREARRAVVMLEGRGVGLMAAEARVRAARLALLGGDRVTAATEALDVARTLQDQGRPSWAAQARVIGVDARLAGGSAGPAELATVRRAGRTLERSGLVAEAVDAHLTAGRVARALGRPAVARQSWDRAAELAVGAPLLVRLKGRVAGALSAASAGAPGVVLHHGRAGLADLAGHRAALPSAELRALASGHGAELGHLGLGAVAASRPPADVLRWMERTRAAALAVVDPPAVEGIAEQLGALRALQSEIAAERRDGGPGLGELLTRQAAIEDAIRRATWRHGAAGDVGEAGASVADLRRALDGRALVEYDVLDGHVVAVVVGPRRTRLVRLGPVGDVRRALDGLSFGLRRMARAGREHAPAVREGAEASLGELAEVLVAPLGLDPTGEIVIVPVGVLQRVPWTALHGGPVSIAPSAAMWVRTSRRRAPAGGRVVLVAGPELPGAVAEVEAIAAAHDGAEVLLPPSSDIARVTTALAGAALAHVACHGVVRADNPMFSSLLVSDGHLSVHELDRRGIAPHRMVLAACESGSEGVYPGNETLGFVSTLLALGTAGLLASSVVVPDWDVVGLMTAVHGSLRTGATMPVALHRARATIDRSVPAGFVSWCAFDAFGAA
jgi:tetratricopeptide (TPR) repeat protein